MRTPAQNRLINPTLIGLGTAFLIALAVGFTIGILSAVTLSWFLP